MTSLLVEAAILALLGPVLYGVPGFFLSAAIVGFASPAEVEAAVAFAERGGLSPDGLDAIC